MLFFENIVNIVNIDNIDNIEGFMKRTREQTEACLLSDVPVQMVKKKPGPGGKSFDHLNIDQALMLANEAFGFDGYTVEIKDISQLPIQTKVVYICRARVTHLASGAFHEDVGTGDAQGGDPGQVHDTAYKGAASDAIKRALRHFGKRVGLYIGRK
jgi:DNA repair and recombination protein RAD52